MNGKKVLVLLTAALLFASTAAWAAQAKAPSKAAPSKQGTKSETTEKPKEHQATGTVVSSSATSLVIAKGQGKNKTNWTFVLTPKTKTTGIITKDAKVVVHYHEDKDQKVADRIKVAEATTEKKPPTKSKAPKSKS